MRVFVTGATGFIGQEVVKELLAAGHSVLGLARDAEKAAALKKAGADAHIGDLTKVDSLVAGAKECDGTIHLAFIHDFSAPNGYVIANNADFEAISAMLGALEGTNKPFVGTSGTAMASPGRTATENDPAATEGFAAIRGRAETLVVDGAKRGIRTTAIRLSPTVHGQGDQGFVPMFVGLARKKGVAAYIGEGTNRWPAVHRVDAAKLFRLALEKGEAGKRYNGVAEEGISLKAISEEIGKGLGVPVKSLTPEEAPAHFEWMAAFAGLDNPTSSRLTQESLGWKPKENDLLTDIREHYLR